MRRLTRGGMSVVMVTHDPDHALYCADRVIVMEEGLIIAEGAPGEVLTTECLQRIYNSEVRMVDVDIDGVLQRVCIPVLKD